MKKEEAFSNYRPLLFAIAYKMTGTIAGSEDILQDVFEKWLKVEALVHNLKAYLAKAITNLCLSFLKEKQKERENYFGLWLPEPLHEEYADALPDEELSFGFLLLFERLSPLERAVYILRESFDLPDAEIAQNFALKEDHCRQHYHRAKERLQKNKRFEIRPEQKIKL